MRRRWLSVWWALVAVGVVAVGLLSLAGAAEEAPRNVRRVLADGSDIWAETLDRTFLQGDETVWWVSHDGGLTWSEASEPGLDHGPDSVTEGCSPLACYRLVDGWQVERRATGADSWTVDFERVKEDSPTNYSGWVHDWEEVPSIAVTDRSDRDEVVVATGDDGALVRTESGEWRAVPVGEPLFLWMWPWILGFLVTVVLLVGLVGSAVICWRTGRVARSCTLVPRPP